MTDNKTAMQEAVEKWKSLPVHLFAAWFQVNSNVLLAKEKEQLTGSYLKALTDTNFHELVGMDSCKEEAEKHYNTTYSNQ